MPLALERDAGKVHAFFGSGESRQPGFAVGPVLNALPRDRLVLPAEQAELPLTFM
jgi:hypothetical protein